MEKLKQYKYIILIGIVVLGAMFYWYSLRPSIIKKDCFNKAYEYSQIRGNDGYSSGKFDKDKYDIAYKMCLQKKGL